MENKKNNSILLTIIGIATLLVSLVGATFAFFTASNSSETQQIETGKLNVATVLSSTDQENIIPTTWDSTNIQNNIDNDNIAKFTFTVDGNGTTVTDAMYDISLIGLVVPGTTEGLGGVTSDVKYQLLDNTNTVVATGDFSEVATGKVIKSGVNITGDITGENSHKYTLCVYILDNGNQDNLQGKTITAQMIATAYTPKPVTQ